MMNYDQEIVDRIIVYLEKHKGEWIPEDHIELLLNQANIGDVTAHRALRRVRSIVNIGSVWSKEKRCMQYTWYERKEGDDLAQKAYDEF